MGASFLRKQASRKMVFYACWDVLVSGGEVLAAIDSEMIRGDSLDPRKSAGQSGVSREILGSLPCSSKVGPK